MAKHKSDINKSQAIRDMLKHHPGAKAREIVNLLASQSIKVTPQMVYVIKGKLAQINLQKRKKAKRVAAVGKTFGNHDPVALVLKVKALSKEAGGMESLKALVEVLAD